MPRRTLKAGCGMPTDEKRLRDLQQIGAKHAQRAGDLEQEIARLREALLWISERCGESHPYAIRARARRALEGKEGD